MCIHPLQFSNDGLLNTLIYTAAFNVAPSDIVVVKNQTLVWDCQATGTPRPIIIWKKNRTDVNPGFPSRVTILANGSLMIINVREEDEGLYQCHASNRLGEHVVQAALVIRGEKKY